ncbi:hypothetical protein LCGC14_2608470, partial [marine sediment metagenome]
PEQVRNDEELHQVGDAIGRCFTRANMNSLLRQKV